MWVDAVDRSRAMFNTAIEQNGVGDPILYILVNMIEEYARHNGHADLIRESLDAWLVTTRPNNHDRNG